MLSPCEIWIHSQSKSYPALAQAEAVQWTGLADFSNIDLCKEYQNLSGQF